MKKAFYTSLAIFLIVSSSTYGVGVGKRECFSI